jgi:transcription termination factor NusA
MDYKLEDVKNVGKKTAEMMRSNGIKSVEDLASIDINELLKVRGIGESTGKKIIENAKLILKNLNKDEKKESLQFEKLSSKSSSLIPSENIAAHTDKKFHKPIDVKIDSKGKPDQSKRDQITKRRVILEKTDIKDHKESFDKKVREFKKKIPSKSISKPEIKKIERNYLEGLFSNETAQRVRFLCNRIKQIKQVVYKDYNNFQFDDLSLFLEYLNNLNINYKNKDHNLILKELDLTQSYYDPISQKTFPISDIMFECARVSWILAKIYVFLSEKFEKKENFENAILAMVKASQIYKTATCFSSSAVYQEKKGITLEAENLELNSEECRILAQGIAASREEKNNNLLLASNLYAGLSVLSKRLYYLKVHEKKKKWQIGAKMNYD